jgi:hypothetical protein
MDYKAKSKRKKSCRIPSACYESGQIKTAFYSSVIIVCCETPLLGDICLTIVEFPCNVS